MPLPNEGTVGTGAVAAALAEVAKNWQQGLFLEVRTIAVEVRGHRWFNYATAARVTSRPNHDLQEQVELGDVTATSTISALEDLTRSDSLAGTLVDWRRKVGAPTGILFSDSWRVDREASHSDWEVHPSWVLRGYEELKDKGHYGAGPGPFFNVETGLFGEDIGALASEWLDMPWLKKQTTVEHTYDIMIPDRRAWFSGYEAEGDKLVFFVEGDLASETLCGAAVSEDIAGREHRQARPIDEGRLELDFPGSVKDLQVWLFDRQGQWLDKYYESQHGASWGPSIYNAPRALQDEAFAAVMGALDSGETEIVEFKAWVDPSSGGKAAEVPRTVVAFANAGGGDLFVGISDDAEIVDITIELKKKYGERCSGDLDCLVSAYVADLKKLIREDVAPAPELEFNAITVAEQLVLRIRVPKGNAGPYSLVRNGAVLFRRGATNKRIAAADLAELIRASNSPSGWS